jgi:hypothetical protein
VSAKGHEPDGPVDGLVDARQTRWALGESFHGV